MDDLSRFCCLNCDCPEHGKRGAGNLTVTHRYGPAKTRRLLRCRACKARFSERKGTPLFGSHLTREKAVSVLHQQEGVLTGPPAHDQTHHQPTFRIQGHVVPAVAAAIIRRVIRPAVLLLFGHERPLLVELHLAGVRGKKPRVRRGVARRAHPRGRRSGRRCLY